eukprot:TRINITY_DN12961_c0_g1_i1.p1 TRINITY_DN12961_c0_g1~~TRINITY_DN12961_c0_g1_i1.p1  ORF type:complete len:415 (+),score=94.66 TRINITY_DN12961_c0_g1_i1:49-1293(+)
MDGELQAIVNNVKKKERSDIKLRDWAKFGFATKRAKEFEEACARQWGSVMRFESTATIEEFAEMERMGQVAIIKGVVNDWKPRDWTFEGIAKSWGTVKWKVGKDDYGRTLRLTMDDYMTYVRNQEDDSPLYVFDYSLGDKSSKSDLLSSFSVPKYFPDDLMQHIDNRPPYRWFLAGPKRSGTCMHIDPLSTSAWNTLLVGRKKWAFLPPHIPRKVAKGRTVMKAGDDDEAINFFVDLIPRMRSQGIEVVEVIQEEGETIFVPGNWWHVVMNITDTVAVTQNYCGRSNFDAVWRASRVERPCMSMRWMRTMERKALPYAQRAKILNETDGHDMEAALKANEVRRSRKRSRHRGKALKKAMRKFETANTNTGKVWDEKQWTYSPSSSDSESTVSTSSSESSSTDSSYTSCTSSTSE